MQQHPTDSAFQSDLLIVGGGASGVLLSIHLLRNSLHKGSIVLVNDRHPLAKGIAYSTTHPEHLLNVRAARMSALKDDPNDFIEWVQSKPELSLYHTADLGERFLPRIVYGEYLRERLSQAIEFSKQKNSFTVVEDEVISLQPLENGFSAQLKSGNRIQSDRVVLATGNTAPEYLPGYPDLRDERILVNPWLENQLEDLDPEKDILLLGASLTMADSVQSLLSKGFKGKIHVLSRHGKFPVTHPVHRPTGHPEIEFEASKDLHLLYRQIKERIRDVIKNQHWQEPVLEAIRPHTQLLWQQFTVDQKKRFLRHLNHHWSILRHRIPAEVASRLYALREEGTLILYSGNLQDIDTSDQLLRVKFVQRPEESVHTINVQRIINCTGPEGNPEKIKRPLFIQLLQDKLVRPDPIKLGLDALPNGTLYNSEGQAYSNFFTLGPTLRGVLWESTAIPEIRVQAANLAIRLSS